MDDAEARAILREHGEEPPKRGTLGASWRDRAQELADFGPAPFPSANGAEPADDYDQGVTPGDFDGVSTAADPPGVPAAAAAAPPASREQRPRRPKRERKSLADRVRSASSGKPKTKKHHPRVRVDGLISRGWALLGGMAARVDPPVGRCLQMQAPIAGLVLEDVVKGTFADRALQPIARAEDKAEKVGSIVLPPLIVAALEMSQQLPEPQRKAREAILLPLLVESLVLGERVAGQYSTEILERAARDEPARQRAAELIGMIFAVPPDGAATSAAESATAAA